MESLLAFLAKHAPSDASHEFIQRRGHQVGYGKGDVIKLPDTPFPYFCVVLRGLVGGYQPSRDGRIALRDLVLPLDFFTGTEHLFTRRDQGVEHRALLATQLLRIPIEKARAGQLEQPTIAELFHVMKQRKINQLRKLVAIYQETDYYARYCVYRQVLPRYARELPHTVQRELLRMSHASYQRVKARYLRGGK